MLDFGYENGVVVRYKLFMLIISIMYVNDVF